MTQVVGAAPPLSRSVLLRGRQLLGRTRASGRAHRCPLSIDVTAQRWWWDMRYNDPVLSNSFTTANEIHIPVGRPVALTLRSMDVIHSFWVPKLHGKKDLIPGQVNTLYPRLTGPAFFAANAPSSAASSRAHGAVRGG